jgi:glycosyltransferase involved in cell wall biosynthesis
MPKSYWRDIVFLLIARRLGCKVVYQVHGGALPEDFFAGSRILTALLHWVLTRPDVVVLLAQVELDAYRQFVPGQRLEVVPNAINIDPLVTESLSSKPHDFLHLVYIGRLAENKGIFEMLAALATLKEQGRNMQLTIGGSGPDEEHLRERVLALGLKDRVVFVGPVFGANKDRLWRTGHIFIFPTYHEGLPYALLEAMAAGAVPITTRVGAIPDVMQDGVHGLLVEAKAPAALVRAIARLDDDRLLLASMAEAGRARVLEHYTVTRLADDFTRIYKLLKVEG